MTKSRLNDFLLSRSSDEEKRTVGDVPEGVSMYAKYKRDIVNRDGGAQPDQRLLDLRDLTHALEVQSSVVFEQIAEAQKRNVLFGPPIQLGPELDGIPMDMRMLYEVRLLQHLHISPPLIQATTGEHEHDLHRGQIGN